MKFFINVGPIKVVSIVYYSYIKVVILFENIEIYRVFFLYKMKCVLFVY